MPADRRGIEEHLRALQRGEPGAFGIPLVPADERADAADSGVEAAEAEIARGEVILLVVERIVGDVHLAVEAEQRAVRVEDHRGVVIDARRALLEERGDQDDRRSASPACGKSSVVGPGIGSARSNRCSVFALAEILRPEKLRQADDLRAARRGLGILSMACCRFLSGSEVVDICISPTCEFLRRHLFLLKEKIE